MGNSDDEDPLYPLDAFLSPQTISPLTVNFNFVEAVTELGEEKTFELLEKLKGMFQ